MPQHITKLMAQLSPPLYIKLGGTAMRLMNVNGKTLTYYRDAGNWDTTFVLESGKLKCTEDRPSFQYLKDLPIRLTTKKVWRKDNAGYVGKETKAYKEGLWLNT